ncbi:50S ribosomal protein L35 [Candidatus Dojkabacteria bacterium]|uniref:50S ribosomal protein L35 n=1 Tax=Candidatus Dojkabacteria bacterium TaxID=2099670 RepID=A0A955LBB6_9BACT|nr:50S ribosomal protein L35 [Candidatus Dojkabacteria bacterium]
MKKNKAKTHKSTAKRFKITGSGKVTRVSRSNRKQRFARNTNSKPSNSDTKKLPLARVESNKVKKLLHK